MANIWEQVFMTTVFIVGNILGYVFMPTNIWIAFALVTSLSLIKVFL